MDAPAIARAYYAALDDERFGDLRDLIAPGFTQHRPDRTFEDREAFLSFMDGERPHTDTTHGLHGIFVPQGGTTRTYERHTEGGVTVHRVSPDSEAEHHGATTADEATTVVVRGTVERDTGAVIVRFVDVFEILADRIVALETYTR